MFLPGPVRGSVVALCIVLLAVSGCRTHKERDDKKATADSLYKKAHKDLRSNDFNAAIKIYEQLTARFPFTDEARQSRLDL
ncbi:MAG TPA: outer membrane protein assembly factor BamD, partial [Steroidobacteraceae bacterium]|nr:outer membrane protein assembly factor BamD [Steroidobacteraceae bacterium]